MQIEEQELKCLAMENCGINKVDEIDQLKGELENLKQLRMNNN